MLVEYCKKQFCVRLVVLIYGGKWMASCVTASGLREFYSCSSSSSVLGKLLLNCRQWTRLMDDVLNRNFGVGSAGCFDASVNCFL